MSQFTPFALSAQLSNHAKAIRDVAISQDNLTLAVGEETSRVYIYQRQHENNHTTYSSFQVAPVHKQPLHLSMLFVLETLQSTATNNFTQATFASGGDDTLVHVFTATGNNYPDLNKHQAKQVNSFAQLIDSPIADFITGAWDGGAYLWKGNQLVMRIEGHQYATQVTALPKGAFVTGSADKAINIYDAQGKLIKKIRNAHDHVIKKLAAHPSGNSFMSAGNDGFLKHWSLNGELLGSWQAHFKGGVGKGKEHDSFVFGLAFNHDGSLVASCGEDRRLNIFQMDGALLQSIPHPGSINSLKFASNGDIITACADRSVRIFTQSPQRTATAEELESFEKLTQHLNDAGAESFDLTSLPDESALTQPGKKHGDSIVVRVDGRGAIAYSWNQDEKTWIEIGEAVGHTSASGSAAASSVDVNGPYAGSKQMLDGKMYDRVIPVEVDASGAKLNLGFDIDEEAEDVAARFMAKHGMPSEYREQIIEFIRPLLDRDAALKKKAALAKRRDDDFFQLPAKRQEYLRFSELKFDTVKSKMLEFNSLLSQQGFAQVLSASELLTLDQLFRNASDGTNYHVAAFPDSQLNLVKKVLSWPTKQVNPMLDTCRALMLHHEALVKLTSDEEVRSSWLRHAQAGDHTQQMFVLRILTNFIARKKKTQNERETGQADEAFVEYLSQALQELSQSCIASSNIHLLRAFSFFVFNFTSYLGRFKTSQINVFVQIATALRAFVFKPELQASEVYQCMVAIGSVALVDEQEIKPIVVSIFEGDLVNLVQSVSARFASETYLVQTVADFKLLFSLKL